MSTVRSGLQLIIVVSFNSMPGSSIRTWKWTRETGAAMAKAR